MAALQFHISPLGVAIVTTYAGLLLLLSVLTAFFIWRRKAVDHKTQSTRFRNLHVQSADGTNSVFRQSGFCKSQLGSALLNGWLVMFGGGYLYTFACCVINHQENLYTPLFGTWENMATPLLIIFSVTHALGIVLVMRKDHLASQFMMPVEQMFSATHVAVEEVLPVHQGSSANGANGEGCHPLADFQNWIIRMNASPSFLLLPVSQYTGRSDAPRGGKEVEMQDGNSSRASVAKAEAERNHGGEPLLAGQSARPGAGGRRYFEFACVVYTYDTEEDAFQPTGCATYQPDWCHEHIRVGGNTSVAAHAAQVECGKNEISVPVLSIGGAVIAEFADVNYIIASVGSIVYWVCGANVVAVLFTIMNIFAGLYRSLGVVRPNQLKIREMSRLEFPCEILRDGKWATLKVSDIALGDVIAVDEGPVPVDGVVVQGGLIVNECMLTGEPLPVQKSMVEDNPHDRVLKKNTAFGGTTCLQTSGPRNGKALIVATAVGGSTVRGELVRMVLLPSVVSFKTDQQMPVARAFQILFTLAICLVFLGPWIDLVTWNATYCSMLMHLSIAFSPMLPVSLLMGQLASCNRLQDKLQINCLQPGKIPVAGKISLMVFDKTGTITKAHMDFESVVPSARPIAGDDVDAVAEFAVPVSVPAAGFKGGQELPRNLRHALACAHSVSAMPDGMLVGSQVEVSMATASGWTIGDRVVSSGAESLEVLRRLEFDHVRMTSGALVRDSKAGTTDLYVKGSYERIAGMCAAGALPQDFDAYTRQLARGGYYVLAVGHRELPSDGADEVLGTSREELESELELVGLLVFRNEIKPDSAAAIKQLIVGDIQNVICTGDNALTGVTIGQACGIIPEGCGTLLGDVTASGELEWNLIGGDDAEPAVHPLVQEHFSKKLAVTQAGWRFLDSNRFELQQLWTRIAVYGRMKPEDKMALVRFLQEQELVVGMCGDGGNDCGALRTAHAGIALSDAEASLVSAFATARDGKSLQAVVDVIREGRACVATNMSSFIYWTIGCYLASSIRLFANLVGGLSVSEFVWLVYDIVLGMAMMWTCTRAEPAALLNNYRPTASILGLRTAASIAFGVITGMLTLVCGELLLWSQEWYSPFTPIQDIGLQPMHWMLRGDNYDVPIAVLTLVVTMANVAYAGAYGGVFRRSILANILTNIGYVLIMGSVVFMIFGPSTGALHCTLRVNCDTATALGAGEQALLQPIGWMSTGGIGDCFMGPQVMIYQDAVHAAGHSPDGKTTWLPSKEHDCKPEWDDVVFDEDLINTHGCTGPNNCYPADFRMKIFGILAGNTVFFHVFYQLVLLGPVATTMRRQQRADAGRDQIEMGATVDSTP